MKVRVHLHNAALHTVGFVALVVVKVTIGI